jgi:hypothetical protein
MPMPEGRFEPSNWGSWDCSHENRRKKHSSLAIVS